MPTVFFLGASGYIGGSVLVELYRRFPGYTYKVLLRNESLFDAFKSAGLMVVPIKGTFADLELVTDLAAEADVVVNGGDSHIIALTEAILRGLKRRFEEGRGVGAYIHTSGISVFFDGNKEGKYDPDGKVWTDEEEDIKHLPITGMHRDVDVAILKAQEEGYFKAFIIAPSMVHGAGLGPVKRNSGFYVLQIPEATRRNKVMYVGEGTCVRGGVHIADLLKLYAIVFEKLVDAKSSHLQTSPYERFVIANAENLTYGGIMSLLAAELHKRGKVESQKPVSATYEEVGGIIAYISAQNTLVRGYRARLLGWVPTQLTLAETISEDISLYFGEV